METDGDGALILIGGTLGSCIQSDPVRSGSGRTVRVVMLPNPFICMRFATLFLVLTTMASTAQTIFDSLPIAYDPASVVFTGTDMSFGDSVLTVNVINTSATPMAYPQLKLVPITPLPPGMVMNTAWSVFASSWNPGETATAEIYFDVAQPIPPDAEVTFAVWATNLTPLLVDDSCRFLQDLTVNLNPNVQALDERSNVAPLVVGPQPASDQLWVELPPAEATGLIELWSCAGQRILSRAARDARNVIDVSLLAPGSYMLVWREGAAVRGRRAVLVVR